jgi:hypothetical protein
MRTRCVAAVAAALLVVVGACAKDDNRGATTTTSATAAATTSTSQPASPQAYVDSGDYVTGLHIAYVTSLNSDDKKIVIDVAQFLIGDAAVTAYKQDRGAQLDGDYYVRNQNKQSRTFALADTAEFRVNNLGGYEPSDPNNGHALSFGEFLALYNSKPGQAKQTLFWISLEAGIVTRVEEQYVP